MHRSLASEDGAAGAALDLIDVLARDLVALLIHLCHVFKILSCRAGAVVEEFELLLVELGCVEAPKDVLEVEGPVFLIDQHHRREVVVRIEVHKRILPSKTKTLIKLTCEPLTLVIHLSGLVLIWSRLRPKKPIARFEGIPIMKNLLLSATWTLQIGRPA